GRQGPHRRSPERRGLRTDRGPGSSQQVEDHATEDRGDQGMALLRPVSGSVSGIVRRTRVGDPSSKTP
ncbi:hypothetical protein AB0C10_36365, partial [Microbispora amethystogenes]|uniref:hypothetical protein n=1 Tax=Microbispora amethystogenes TaxID=1427754 RepID=UPI0033DCC4B4